MAKDKKSGKAKTAKANDRLELLDGGEGKKKKGKKKGAEHGLDAFAAKLLDHPLVADLLAVGALAAVAAIAESGKADPLKAKSKDAVKAAGKAAAAAIGTRLLKEVTGGAKKKA